MKTVTRNEDRDAEHGGPCFDIVGPVDLAQLDAEIVSAQNWRKAAGLVMDTVDWDNDPDTNTLWVTHENADEKVIAKALKAHKPKAEPEDDVETLVARVRDGETLTQEQTGVLLAHLLEREGEQAKA